MDVTSIVRLIILPGIIIVGLIIPTMVYAQDTMTRIGVPLWPGATVKTEVVTQILNCIGYQTRVVKVGSVPVILRGVSEGDLDINLSVWHPLLAQTIDPLLESGAVVKLATNMPDGATGVAVPAYVHEAGVDSVKDLARFVDRFKGRIYGVESGAEWNVKVAETIHENQYDLGDWQMIPSSVAGMLTQVDRAIQNNQWIAFHGWKPHWMNIKFDLYYLTAPKDSKLAQTHGKVYTVANSAFPDNHPNLSRFFRQFQITARTQSKWILEYSFNERSKDAVAQEWIATHLDNVVPWLKNVKTADDNDPIQSLKACF